MGPKAPSPLPAAQLSAGLSHRRRCLQALSRLNERDTQGVGFEELTGIITSTADAAEASMLLSLLCNTGLDQRPHARKESVRLLGLLNSSSCPVHEAVLQAGTLSKVLAYLRTRIKDSDASVRTACADTVGILAENMSQCSSMPWVGDTASNPVLKLIFDLLSDQKREIQSAVCLSLSQVVPHLPSLSFTLWRQLLRLLNSSSFQARPDLISTIARCSCDHTSCSGLLTLPLESTTPYLDPLMGRPSATGPTGLLGCTLSPDWAVRKAAADGIRAAAVILGPALQSLELGTIASALNPLRFDKMKPVRSAAIEALAVLSNLQAYKPSGEDAQAAWRQICIELRAAGSPASTPLASPARSLTALQLSGKSRSSSLGDNSMLERFKSAGRHQDLVVASPLPLASDARVEHQAEEPPGAESKSYNMASDGYSGMQSKTLACSSTEVGCERPEAGPFDSVPPLVPGKPDVLLTESASKEITKVTSSSEAGDPAALHSATGPAAEYPASGNPDGEHRTASLGKSLANIPALSTSLADISIAEDSVDEPTARPSVTGNTTEDADACEGMRSRSASESFDIFVQPAKAKRPSLSSGAITPRSTADGDTDSICSLPRNLGPKRPGNKSGSPSKSSKLKEEDMRSSVALKHKQAMHSSHKAANGTKSLARAGVTAANSEDLARLLEQQSAVIRVLNEFATRTNDALAALTARLDRLEHAEEAAEAQGEKGMQSQLPTLKLSAVAFPGFNTPCLQHCDSPTDFRKPSSALSSEGDKRQSRSGSPDQKASKAAVAYMTRSASNTAWHTSGATSPSLLSPVTSMDTSWTNYDSTDGDATPDLESRYAEAIRNANCASASGELELLRLMQRTGSAWAELSPETANGLLSTMIKLLHERTAIPRILPWLKELAHPSCTLSLPQTTQGALLAALASVPASEDTANKGRVSNLLASLRASWVRDLPHTDTKPPSLPPHAAFLRKSLDDVKAELEEMQSQFHKV